MQEQKPHYEGHRARLRERYRLSGFEGFRPYETLELLLTYAIPRKDVKPIAKALIERFGDLRGVLDAPIEELMQLDGLSENSATFLHIVRDSWALYLRDCSKQTSRISSTSALLNYCQVAMSGLKDEHIRVIFLNAQNDVITDEVLSRGSVDHSYVDPRKVMERALKHNATAIILVHNHPGGSCKPSKDDMVLTSALAEAARHLRIALHDHLIICKTGYYSFLEQGDL